MVIQQQIAKLLERRHTQLPKVHQEIKRWENLAKEIHTLNEVINELSHYAATPDSLKIQLQDFNSEEILRGIAKVTELLHILEARFSRKTINIGVSGRARVGKSTLLQSISGLSDEQIPTGSGLPVTAVRSRIFHSSVHQRATLTLHTFKSFRDEILQPYHDELGLSSPPFSVQEFQAFVYPKSESELAELYRDKHTSVSILRRLKEMQDALPSFTQDLVGGEKTVSLSGLRQYVAYPTNEEVASTQCSRRYLAVKDVRIECNFPYAQVDQVGIIDLPGLGELAANAEQYHLSGLQNEVDLVLLIKRPVEGLAYWGREDGAATNLLDKARGFINQRRDFVFIVLNSAGINSPLEISLRDDICRQVNDGIDGKHFQVLEGNASDQKSVYDDVLAPVLAHLANRLPVMDDEVYEGTVNDFKNLAKKINNYLTDLEVVLKVASKSNSSTTEDLEFRASELRRDLAGELAQIVERYQVFARSSDDDPQYLDSVEDSFKTIESWMGNGFGVGAETWKKNALRQMRVDRNSSPFTAQEMNSIRVEIGKHFCGLDYFFISKVKDLWNETGSVFEKNLGHLLAGKEGRESLKALAEALKEAYEPCPTLTAAVDDLIELKIDYRTQLHPRVRRELDGLNLQIKDIESGKYHDQIVVEVSEAGVEELLKFLTEVAQQAAYRTKKSLIQERKTPALVLHAAIEQFEDSIIRSGDSEKEFRRLARSYRNEIWPGIFQGIEETNAKFAKVEKTIRLIRNSLSEISGSEK
jgi:hypothetical protein